MTIGLFNQTYSHIILSTTAEALDNRLIFILTRLLKELNTALADKDSFADIFAIQIDEISGVPTLHLVLKGAIKTSDINYILEKWPQEFKRVLL
jgi:hypothetical protein